ncbi:MAG: Jag N-terminal domain-containing protein [Chloroflexota bacterium]|nr:Jag N-terminal domain-containing protein [Chloroflexota bacterium]
MTFREFSGKNVEEAIRTAMKEFSADLSELDIEILSQGSRGILGVGGEEARILAAPRSAVAAAPSLRAPQTDTPGPEDEAPRVESPGTADPAAAEADIPDEALADDQAAELSRAQSPFRGRSERGGRGRPGGRGRGESNGREPGGYRGSRGDRSARPPRSDRPDRPERPPRPEGDRPPRESVPFIPGKPLEELSEKERAILDEAKSVLEELLRLMDIPSSVEIATGGETAKLNVKGSDLGVLIGRRGEKLASLQHLVNLIVSKREGQWNRIAVDVENYRGRREEQLRDVADRAAKRVLQTGKIIQLEAMPAVERRIVHMALLENPSVRTQSVGVEPNRRIVVLPATKIED